MQNWLGKIFFIALLLPHLLARTSVGAYPLGMDVDEYGKYLRAHGNYILQVGMARVLAAQEALIYAQVHHLETETKYLQLFVKQLRKELFLLQRRQWDIARLQKQVERYSRDLSLMKNGYVTRFQLQALWNLKRLDALTAAVLLEAEKGEVEELPIDNFVPNRKQRVLEVPFPGGNRAELIAFVGQHDVSIRYGSPAYFHLLEFFAAIEVSIQEKISDLERHWQSLRDSTLDIWRPPSTDGLVKPYPTVSYPPAGGYSDLPRTPY